MLRVLLMTVSFREFPTLEELAGWPHDEADDAPQVIESDIDVAAEIADEDEEYENGRAYRDRRENKWNPYSWG